MAHSQKSAFRCPECLGAVDHRQSYLCVCLNCDVEVVVDEQPVLDPSISYTPGSRGIVEGRRSMIADEGSVLGEPHPDSPRGFHNPRKQYRDELAAMASHISGLNDSDRSNLINMAEGFWTRCRQEKIKGNPRQALIAGLLFIACRKQEFPFTIQDFSSVAGIKVGHIDSMLSLIRKKTGIRGSPLDPGTLVEQYCRHFFDQPNDRTAVQDPAENFCADMKRDLLHVGRFKPTAVTAAAVLLATRIVLRKELDIRELENLASCHASTIKARLREFVAGRSGLMNYAAAISCDLPTADIHPSKLYSTKRHADDTPDLPYQEMLFCCTWIDGFRVKMNGLRSLRVRHSEVLKSTLPDFRAKSQLVSEKCSAGEQARNCLGFLDQLGAEFSADDTVTKKIAGWTTQLQSLMWKSKNILTASKIQCPSESIFDAGVSMSKEEFEKPFSVEMTTRLSRLLTTPVERQVRKFNFDHRYRKTLLDREACSKETAAKKAEVAKRRPPTRKKKSEKLVARSSSRIGARNSFLSSSSFRNKPSLLASTASHKLIDHDRFVEFTSDVEDDDDDDDSM